VLGINLWITKPQVKIHFNNGGKMIDLKQYGYTENEKPEKGLIIGRVTEHRHEQYTVITEHGEVTSVLKGSFYHNAVERGDFPCIGDFVLMQHNASGHSLISKVLPRRSKFSRSEFSGHKVGYVKTVLEQVVAANFDYVFILSSLNADFNVSRILRYVSQARQSGGKPVIILTKADLTDDYGASVAEVKQTISDIPIHAISSHTGHGLDELSEYLQPTKTIVFLGMSGVGKSSLLNVLMENEVMAVNVVREDDSCGRHTTTHRQLFMLPSGAMVIDTPGMRELGLFDVDEGISAGFSDVEDLFDVCKFRRCQHKTEPGCAVLAALADGSLSRDRWERYLEQTNENDFARNKRGPNYKK
jgi:ribosome biogenesis GTPase